MIPGYHAGELWLHDPARAISQLAEIGYRSVAIRSRQGVCVPGDAAFDSQWQSICDAASQAKIRLIVDSEASYVVDPKLGSLPSLASTDESIARSVIDWIEHWIQSASACDGTILSIASGEVEGAIDESSLDLVANRLENLARRAQDLGVVLAVRPAIGHAIASVAQFERLRQWLPGEVSLGLAADVGEMIHAGEMPLVARLQRQADDLRLVYLCDTGSTYPGSGAAEESGHEALSIGRMDVPLGTGELAVERIVGELAKFTREMPMIVRVAGQAGAGLRPARAAMNCLNAVPSWRNARGG